MKRPPGDNPIEITMSDYSAQCAMYQIIRYICMCFLFAVLCTYTVVYTTNLTRRPNQTKLGQNVMHAGRLLQENYGQIDNATSSEFSSDNTKSIDRCLSYKMQCIQLEYTIQSP